ncbi:MAG: FG-GAP repeat protein [Parcubacteria group bacterium]|nr:FG-GAP repeat protein [Parcubacteria group bacterium]
MKIKTKFLKNQLEKYRIVILLIPILAILSLTYATSKSFLAEGQEGDNTYQDFQIYEDITQDKVTFACGDINGDEVDEIITTTFEKGSDFKIFNTKGVLEDTYKSFSKSNKNNFDFVTGDIDGDSKDEIIKFSTEKSSLIEVLKDNKVISRFEVFKNLNIGTTVASGDVDGDGMDEIVVGAGKGGGPQVDVFDGVGNQIASLFVFSPSLRNGINVATGNVDEDAIEEIIVSQKREGEGVVRIYKLDNIKTSLDTFMAYPDTIKAGANIIASDLDNDNKSEIITAKDVDNDEFEMELFDSQGNALNITNEAFSNITHDSEVDACDFQDKKGIATSYERDGDVRMEIIYSY